MSKRRSRAAPATSPPAEANADRLARLLGVCCAAAFERVGSGDALLGAENPWAAFGFQPGELPATHTALLGLLHPEDRAQGAPLVAQALDGEVLLGRLRQHDGSYRRYRQRTRVVHPGGGPAHVACCLIDVEDIERERDAARLAHQLLQQQAGRLRAEAMRLVAHASHEIRTPLNGVLGLVELARHSPGTDAQRRHLDMATQSGHALTRVLNDVLDLASLDSTPLVPRLEWIDLDELLSEALRSITPQMAWGDFSVVYDFDGELFKVRADPGRLRQILINLLGNAAGMTRQGHVGLCARVHRVEGDRCALNVVVEDTGPGIPPDKLPTLFEPFAMASAARRRGGTGLGLSIVQTLVAALGGSITVHSVVGAGTRFELQFTLEAEPSAERPAGPPTPGGHAWLVYGPAAEPSGVWLRRRLARMGWTCDQWHSVADAMARSAGPQPGLVLVAAHTLQSTDEITGLASAWPGTRQVLVSRADWQRPDIEQRAHDLGLACILAPVSQRSLLAMVAPRSEPTAPAALPGSEAALTLRGHVLLVDDDEVNRLIGEQILAGVQLSVDSAASGEAALQACLTRPPDIVLMDVQMAGMGGIEACRQIRAQQQSGRLPPFPIIGLTADSTAETAATCASAGMDTVLTKPYRAHALQAELARRLPQREG